MIQHMACRNGKQLLKILLT